jgi:S1-C subfamily serine protease
MENSEKPPKPRLSVAVVAVIVIVCLLTDGLLGYLIFYYPNVEKIGDLQNRLSTAQAELLTLQDQLSNLQDSTGSDYQNVADAVSNLQDQLSALQTQINGLEAESNAGSQDSVSLQAMVASLQSQLTALQTQIANIQASSFTNITYVLGENVSLSQLFDEVKGSVVVIQGRVGSLQVQGSGFVYSYGGTNLILTNNHVVDGAVGITVTFTTGNSYTATVVGSSPEADFAVLTTTAPQSSYQPLEITSSSTLRVGDPVIVVGAPYGLSSSMTNGIVSALNRTLTTDVGTTLTNVIQTTAPLNPGNSGGPLMNYNGQVVGITTAIVADSQGIGFAIPSDTILSEIQQIMMT